MAAADNTSSSSSESSPSTPAKRRRLKWVLIAAGGVVGGLGLLVLVTPTLLSTGAGKNFVLGQVNKNLNGKVEIDSWSLGWFSGIEVSGIRVLDDQQRTAITVGRFKTDLTVLKAAMMNLDLGETVIDNVNLVTIEANRTAGGGIETNLQRIAKTDPNAKPQPAPSGGGAPSKIPDVRGNITIKNLTGTIQGTAVGPQPIRIGESQIGLKIPSLADKPVSNDIKLVVGKDGSGMGTITVVGAAQAIYGGVVDTKKLAADQKVTLAGIDLSTANGFLSGLQLGGVAEGAIDAKLAGTESVDARGEIRVANLSAAGQALKGDRFATKLLTVPVSVATTGGVIKIEKLGASAAEFDVSVTGEVPQAALTNLGAMKPPGAAGKLAVVATVPDVGVIATQLPRTLALAEGLKVEGGRVDAAVNVALEAASATVTGQTKVAGVRGTRAGQPVTLSPITVAYDAAAKFAAAGGLAGLDLRQANLTSSFANLGASGSLEELKYSADVSLDRARQELSQFVDFGGTEFGGALRSAGTVRGLGTETLSADTQTTLTGLRARLPAKGESPAMDVSLANLGAVVAGTVKGGKISTSRPLQLELRDVSLARGGQPVLRGETLTVSTAGEITTGNGTKVELSSLDVRSSSGLVEVRQAGEKLLLDLRPDGTLNGSGGVTFAADLARASRLGDAWAGRTTPPAQQIRSGRAAGQVNFGQQGAQLAAKGSIDLTSLTVGDLLRNENVAVTFDASSPDAFKTLSASADVKSAFANVSARNATLELGAGVWEMVRSAAVTVKADDLAKVDALMKAFAPPAPPAAGEAAVPPLFVRSGSLNVDLGVARSGAITNVEVRTLQVNNLELSKGAASYRMPAPVDLKVAASVDAATANGATVMDQIRSLTVSALDGSLGVATIKLAEPLVVTDLKAAVPDARGTVQLAGRIQTVTGLLEVLGGQQPGSQYPYVGDFAVEQKLGKGQGGMTTVAGRVTVNNLKLLDNRGRVQFSEDRLEVANDVGVDAKTFDIALSNLSVNMASSKALSLGVTGLIRDAKVARRFEQPLRVKLDYDLARLMPLLVPIIDPTGETFGGGQFSGQHSKEFVVSGSYPANVPPEQAIRQLAVTGGIAVGQVTLPKPDYSLSGLDLNFALRDGVATLARDAKPFTVNGGSVDVSGLVVDLTKATPRLTVPDATPQKPKALAQGIALSKGLSVDLFSKVLPVPALQAGAQGKIDVTINELRDLPLGAAATQPRDPKTGEANNGVADLLIGGQVSPSGPVFDALGSFANVASLRGQLATRKLRLDRGVVDQDMSLNIGERGREAINFLGQIDAANLVYREGYVIRIPSGMLKRFSRDLASSIPEGFDVPVKGPVAKPQLDFGGITRVLERALQQRILPGLLGGERPAPGGAQPAQPAPGEAGKQSPPPATKPADPLGDLLRRGLEGGRNRDKR